MTKQPLRPLRVLVVLALAFGSIAVAAAPARALFHLMLITEVLAGTSTAPDAHLIEMQMYAENQRFLTGHEVAVFNAAGEEVEAFTFTSPVADGSDQSYVLLATEQAESEFGIEADLAMTPALVAGGGRVCFRSADGGIIDCVSWGNYSGDDSATGTPFNAALGLLPGQSMHRVTTGGTNPQGLDPGDDTNDSEADFEGGSPDPSNNAGGGGPSPEPIVHDRSVSLALRRSLVAKGTVSAEGNFAACFRSVSVRVQRRSGGSWKTIARTTTNDSGSYRARLRDRPGRYRAVAPAFSPEDGHRCAKGVSPIRRRR